jgi:hypothetical protein
MMGVTGICTIHTGLGAFLAVFLLMLPAFLSTHPANFFTQ